jgi:molecular chaperone HtpG
LNIIREIARKWIVIPDCNVTVQVDDEPEERVGFGSPKEALEDSLVKLGINRLEDGNWRIKINQEKKNGVTLAYGVQWYEHFKEWNFMYPPTRGEDRESMNIVGTCVEGIRIDSATPGFTKPGLFAIANATGRHASTHQCCEIRPRHIGRYEFSAA